MKYSQDRLEELLTFEGIILSGDGVSYENTGKDFQFERFPCYGCLRKYKSWWASRVCRWFHKTFTPWKTPRQMIR